MNIQWYPGHMTKARRMMEESIKLVDVVIEMIDARVPMSSRNPELLKIAKNKPRVVVMNKIDLADEPVSNKWAQFLKNEGAIVVQVNARDGKGTGLILQAAKEACKEKIERDKRRGLINRPIRAMVAGIPNVGKSTLINKLVGKSSAKTGNKPGITKGKQWIKLNKEFELLDTPGLLWPKFEDQTVGLHLALIGSIKEDILDTKGLAHEMLSFMQKNYPELLKAKYPVEDLETLENHVLLERLTKMRNLLKSGGEADTDRMAVLLLEEFRNGKLGRMTLDRQETSVEQE